MAVWNGLLAFCVVISYCQVSKCIRVTKSVDVDILERLSALEKVQRENQAEIRALRETVDDQKNVIVKHLLRISQLEHDVTTLKVSERHQSKQLQRHDRLIQTLLKQIRHSVEAERGDRHEAVQQWTSHSNLNANTTSRQNTGAAGGNIRTSKRQGPEIVAFSVYLDHDENLGDNQVVKFNQIITNEGNGYNVHTGVFTCVTPGIYMFHVAVGERDNNQFIAGLRVNSQNVVMALAQSNASLDDDQGSNMVVVRLNQGDSVFVNCIHNNRHVEGSSFLRLSTFSGVLLSP